MFKGRQGQDKVGDLNPIYVIADSGAEIGHFRPVFAERDRFGGSARMFVPRRVGTPDAGYGGVGVKVDLLVPNHRGRSCEAAMVAARNYR